MKWRFINTDCNDGPTNMAIDESILIHHSKGLVPPTLRFYRWKPATVSLGYFQKMEREVDVEACLAAGIDIVRRISGGRAVLHDEELTYSVVASEGLPEISRSITECYKFLSQGLLRGFLHLGIEAELSPLVSLKGQEYTSAACFDAPSTYELTVHGKKIVGSAQVRQRGVMLQHGSILNDLDVAKLFLTIRMDNTELKERLKLAFNEKATSIRHEKGQREPWDTLCQAFFTGFDEVLGVEMESAKLTEGEMELAKSLAETKYTLVPGEKVK